MSSFVVSVSSCLAISPYPLVSMSCSLYRASDSIRTGTMSYLSFVPSTLSTDPVLCPQLQALRNVLQEWMNDRIASSLNAGASGLLGVFVLSCSLLLPTPTWLSGTYLNSLNMRQEPLFGNIYHTHSPSSLWTFCFLEKGGPGDQRDYIATAFSWDLNIWQLQGWHEDWREEWKNLTARKHAQAL